MLQRRNLILTGATVTGLVALYAAIGFLLVPKLARDAFMTQCRDEWQRSCSVAEIRFNPFRLAAEVKELTIADADGSRMLGVERLAVDIELASLWRRALVFGSIAVDAPFVRAVQRADGSLNLMVLAPKTDPEEADEPLPRVAIADLAVNRGHVEVRDEDRPEPFQLVLEPLAFRLQEFSTFAAGEHFRLVAGSDRAGQIDWQGTLATTPLASAGTIALTGVPAKTVSDLLGEQLPFQLRAGALDFGFRYDFGLDGQPLRLALSDGRITSRDLELRGHGQEQSWTVGTIALSGATLDLGRRKAAIARVSLADARTPLWLDAAGVTLPGVEPRAAAGTAATATPATGAGATAAAADDWRLEVPELSIARVQARIEDRRGRRAVPFDLTLPALTVRGYRWPDTGALQIDGRLESAAGGVLSVRGTATPEPLATELDVDLDGLSLAPLKPYIESGRALQFLGATLSAQGRLRYDATAGPRFAGDAALADLHTRDAVLREDFLRWRRIDVRGIDYAGARDGLVIREIAAREPYLRLIVGADGITNLQDVLDPAGARATRAAADAERAAKAAKASAQKTAKRSRGAARGRAKAAPPPAVQPPPPAPLLPFPARIERVRVEGGSLNFTDYTTLRPYFAAGIQGLAGTIDGLSSDPAARARVALTGKVDRYAPVNIDGEVNYLAATSYTDLAASFRNIELTTFTPYAGKFAGYRINKGKLTAELRYRVEDRKLDAKHRIVADQLELGEKVDSPDATRLPVKLVLALLKDRHGVIDLSIPVTGTLDDPKFRLGPVIWKIVLNLLTKIVTSPFALLGGLFGDGPDLSVVDFNAGQAALDEAAKTKLDTLKKGLIERPGLKLEIPAVAIEASDRPALARQRYEAALTRAAASFAPKGGAAPAAETLRADPKRWRALLVRAWTEHSGQAPEIPQPPPRDGDAPPADALAFGNEWLERELEARIQPDADALRALGQARAEAVRDAVLADGQIDVARVFLTQGQGTATDSGQARMTLKLE
jgi:hypothetical protein